MSELIIHSRITPPKLQDNIIHRERLTNLLFSNINKKIIVISAPAGYGKTTLVQDFMKMNIDNPNCRIKFAWLQASSDIKSFFSFITYIIYSLKQLSSDFGENTLQLIDSIKEIRFRRQQRTIKNDIDEITGTLINELHKFNCIAKNTISGKSSEIQEKLFLVIDDFNTLDNNSWINSALDLFLDLLPANVSVLIISRTKPGFNLTKLYAHRNIFELGTKDLTFTFNEIKKLIEEIYSLYYSEDVLKHLELKFDGWITGIHLAVQTYGEDIENKLPSAELSRYVKKPALKKLPEETPILSENIFRFFANEIYEKLDKNTQRFLTETSILEYFDSDICNYLLNISNSANIIKQLLTKNIFIQQITELSSDNKHTHKTVFQYQPSFSSFLQNKLQGTFERKDIQSLYNRVAEYFLSSKNYISAINYYILAENMQMAVKLLKEHFQNLFSEGKYELLWKMINMFSDELIHSDPYLLYYKGLLYRYFMSELDIALGYIEESIALFEKQHNHTFIINNYVTKAALLIHFGKTQEVIEDLLRLSEVKTTAGNRALLLYYLGYAYYINTQYDEAINYLNQSMTLCQSNKLPAVLYDIFNVLGNIFLNRGDFIKSTYYFEQNYETGFKTITGIDKNFLTICNLIDLYAQSGKYEKAKQFLDKGYEIINAFAVPIFELILSISEARLRFEIGDYEETIRISEKLNLLSKKFNRRYHIYLSYRLLAAANQYLNKYDKANEYLNLAGIYINETNKFQITEFAVAQHNLEISSKQVNDIYEETMLNACKFFNENNFHYDKIQIYFYLAKYYLRKHNYRDAYEYTSNLFKIASEKEYVSFLEREFRQSREVFDYAIQNNICVDFIKKITNSNLEKINTHWLSKECKMRLSAEAHSIYDITMNVFGTLNFKIRGTPIPDERWKRKIRKLILAYIMINRKKNITKEKIIDIFFQNSPAESVDNIFHQSISNIRFATSIKTLTAKKLTKKDELINPSYIIYENKILNLNPSYIYYIDAEEFDDLYNKINSSETDLNTKIILSKRLFDLYKGELLPGYYFDWCEELRTSYLNKFIDSGIKLLGLLKKQNLYEDIIIYAEKILKYDRINDNAFLYLIEAYVLLENYGRANDTFKIMKKNFNEEFEGKPPKEIFTKAENIFYSNKP